MPAERVPPALAYRCRVISALWDLHEMHHGGKEWMAAMALREAILAVEALPMGGGEGRADGD